MTRFVTFAALAVSFVAFLCLVSLHPVSCKTNCDSVKAMNPFNVTAYTGTWYEISRYKNSPGEKDAYCATTNISWDAAKKIISMTISENTGSPTGPKQIVTGQGTFPDPQGHPGQFTVNLQGHDVPIYVLSSNYKDYSLVFACGHVSIIHFEFGWILSRKPTMDEQTRQSLLNEWKNTFHLDPSEFVVTPQQGCSY